MCPLLPESDSRRRDLGLILAEGIAFSIMVGIGESYIAAFVLALNLGEVAAGLAVTVPLLAGGLLQLVTPQGVRHLGSRRRWATLCAALQAASFLPLIGGAMAGRLPAWVLFAAVTGYWGAGMAAGPAWNVWVERIVPRRVRLRYFARRTGFVQLGILVGLFAGAAVLERFEALGKPLAGFALVFAVAALARFISARILAAQSEDLAPADPPIRHQLWAMLQEFRGGDGGRLLLYLLAFTSSVAIASPYFSPYMLVRLELSYWQYMALIGASLLTKVLVLTLLARLARRLGLLTLLRIAWIGILPLPFLWLLSSHFFYLMGLQILAGAFWGTQEYATFLLFFETIPTSRRVAVLTTYNLGNALATVGGALLGAWFFKSAGGDEAGYFAIFGASSLARAACLLLLMRVRGGRLRPRSAAPQPLPVRPGMGTALRPMLAAAPGRRHRIVRDHNWP